MSAVKNKVSDKIVGGLDKALIFGIVRQIRKYKEPEKIVIFGSRASSDFKARSDIDIAIFGKDWTDRDINIVKHNLDEFVKIPLKFDVLNFYTIGKQKLKKEIINKGRIVYDSGEN